MDIHLEKVKSLLFNGLDGVRMVGIWGLGGIGKTTIARAIYDEVCHQFEGCYFLEDVKSKPISQSRNELLSEILSDKNLKAPTLRIMKERLRYNKVLIVLDDIDKHDHLENLAGNYSWFGTGSKIIITTRDKSLLEKHGVKEIYDVPKLDDNQSHELFTFHAFRDKHPKRKLLELSNSVITYCNGLPLALKVLGSSLYNKTVEQWQDAINKLETIPDGDILKVLQLSYDGLPDDDVRDIFLDVACFFFMEPRIDIVTAFLKSSDYYVDIGLAILRERSLLTISDNRLSMHGLVREMGKRVAQQEHPRKPGRRRRLCISKDIWRVLAKNSGTEEVEGISLDISRIETTSLSSDTLARMCNLRLLQIYASRRKERSICRLHFPGGLESFPDQLRYLYWEGYPLKFLPFSSAPSMLVKIDIENSNIECLWKGQQSFQLPYLREINLVESQQLKELPDLSCAPNLKVIHLSGSRLENIPCSVSNLSALESLSLWRCLNVTAFPDVPSSIEILILNETSIEEVPSSIERLSRLDQLSMSKCRRIRSLPTSLCKLKCLRFLALSDCSSLESFPEITKEMDQLEYLYLDNTAIDGLHSSIELLVGLKNLSLIGCKNLVRLPDSLCNLEFLEDLRLDWCPNLTELPENLGNLKSLSTLSARKTPLKMTPEVVGRLSVLEDVRLSDGMESLLPHIISHLSQVTELDISPCARLKSIQKLSHGLKILRASGSTPQPQETREAGFDELGSLVEYLCFIECEGQIKPITDLPLKLQQLSLIGCDLLEALPDNIKDFLGLDDLDDARFRCAMVGYCLKFGYAQNEEAINLTNYTHSQELLFVIPIAEFLSG